MPIIGGWMARHGRHSFFGVYTINRRERNLNDPVTRARPGRNR